VVGRSGVTERDRSGAERRDRPSPAVQGTEGGGHRIDGGDGGGPDLGGDLGQNLGRAFGQGGDAGRAAADAHELGQPVGPGRSGRVHESTSDLEDGAAAGSDLDAGPGERVDGSRSGAPLLLVGRVGTERCTAAAAADVDADDEPTHSSRPSRGEATPVTSAPIAARTDPSWDSSAEAAAVGAASVKETTIAVLRSPSQRSSSCLASASSRSAASRRMRTVRSRSFAFVATTETMRLSQVRPRATMSAVENPLSVSF